MESWKLTSIATFALTLKDLKSLPPERQSRLLLRRLATAFPHPDQPIGKMNFALPAYASFLVQGYPDGEQVAVADFLLGAPWKKLENDGLIRDNGHGFFYITAEGWETLESLNSADNQFDSHIPPTANIYHVQIIIGKGKKDLFEYDLEEDYVADKIVRPYIEGSSFFFGGRSIERETAEQLRIVRTETPAEVLASKSVQSFRANRVMMGHNMAKERIVSHAEGSTDVTRLLFDRVQQMISQMHETPLARSSSSVFIVHGHDHDLLKDLELTLHRWKLDPIVLSEKANRGMTLIEKVEANTSVRFAFVLLTPDDVGGKDARVLSPRARQNVIWEWGYLVGRLGRDRVCCLFKEGVEIPSDLRGEATINVGLDLKESLEEIRRELKSAGFDLS